MSNDEPAFEPSNEFIKKLSSLPNRADGILIEQLMSLINNHNPPRVTECGDEKFIAYDEECKILYDRKIWKFVNFDLRP
ncbi:hypothetical protein [Nitrosopumilus ureiphilus]|uniref:Uncharacterized protein n=1 Tax=Nitrosopumilus ureiphilus TaxID=1470067 RepID=A0A7D5RBT0_9ARCH|nr:hypothetical protein [Nitrosopumilus ureiphilus]QLH07424.1 hypothetical protein C5F50_10360 [Nitrosopumilus ureiphilus]